MKKKQQRYVIKGMNKDISISKGNNEYSYHNHNIRIDVNNDSSLLSITNEKGTEEVCKIKGIVLGHSTINDSVVLFSKDEDIDYIHLFNGNELTILYEGDLYFSVEHPIECTSIYESEDIQRVYWADGKNVLRSINIKDKKLPNVSSTYFNIDSNLKGGETINVVKKYEGGIFPSGVIQYYFTYFNQFGKESSVFMTSDTYYLSFKDRGGSPEETVDCTFSISLDNLNNEYDYVRCYSVIYTSNSSTPLAQLVGEYKIEDNKVYVYDSNTDNETIDPTELMFKGSESISPYTITSKDNTLFLGNYKNLRKTNIKYSFKEPLIREEKTYGGNIGSKSNLVVNYNLEKSREEVSHFKKGECYILGVVFKHHNGKYSNPIWVKNYIMQNGLEYQESNNDIEYYKHEILLSIPEDLRNTAKSMGYIQILPVIHRQPLNKRRVLCTGVINPTIYNVGDRKDNSPYFQSSWLFRPNASINDMKYMYSNGIFASIAEYRHNKRIGLANAHNGEIRNYVYDDIDDIDYSDNNSWNARRSRYMIDRLGVSLYSPDVEILSGSTNIKQIDVAGIAPIHFNTSKYDITTSEPLYGSGKHDTNLIKGDSINTAYHSLLASPSWKEDALGDKPTEEVSFLVYPFNNIGSMGDSENVDDSTKKSSILEKKSLYINRKSYYNIYFDTPYSISTEDSVLINSTEDSLYQISREGKSVFYKNYIDKILTTNEEVLGSSNVYYPIIKANRINNSLGEGFNKDTYTLNTVGNIPGSSGSHISYINNSHVVLSLKEELPSIYNTNDIQYIEPLITQDWKMLRGFKEAIEQNIVPAKIKGTISVGWSDFHSADLDAISKDEDGAIVFKYANVRESLRLFLPYMAKASYTINNALVEHFKLKRDSINGMIDSVSFYASHSPERVGIRLGNGGIKTFDNMNFGYVRVIPNKDFTGYSDEAFQKEAYAFVNKVIPKLIEEIYTVKSNNQDNNVVLNSYIPQFSQNNVASEIKNCGFLLIGDVINNINPESEEYLKNTESLQWVYGGSLHSIDSKEIRYTNGDFFLSRYNAIGTLPRNEKDINQIIDIFSFICESRINTSLFYDKNRLSDSNTNVSNTNYNKRNDVYDSGNTLLTFNGVEEHYLDNDDYPVHITISKKKNIKEYIDTWQHITGIANYNLEGVYGEITKLSKINDNIIAFQDNSIATILFNSRVQIQTSDNVPVEISNSGKLEGHRYISTEVGCQNKWSVCNSKVGILFIDDNSDNMYILSNGLEPLSEKFGFRRYMQQRANRNVYTPKNNATISFYDEYKGDIYIINDKCLSYSTKLTSFESFFDYIKVEAMFNINSDLYSVHNNTIWRHGKGEYNNIYGIVRDFSIHYRINPEGMNSKVFTNLEFRADSYLNSDLLRDISLDEIQVYNEYQEGSNNLEYRRILPSNIKKKFRVWRADIPREYKTMNRISNPWCNIILKSKKDITKTIIHDLTITYYE